MSKHIRNRAQGLPADLLRRLTAARSDHNLTQRELAAMVGLPQVHISSIETGKVVPQYNTLLEIVRVLDHDLMLVPRSLVPAVQSILRDAAVEGDEERPLYAVEPEEDDGDDS